MTGVIVSAPDATHLGRKSSRGRATTGVIICGVDDSEAARGAVRVARMLSVNLGARLWFVRTAGTDVSDVGGRRITDDLDRLLLEDGEVGDAWLLGVRSPADCLVDTAAELDASMIVIGSNDTRSATVESVAAEVSRRASCPVVVVPPGAGPLLTSKARHSTPGLGRVNAISSVVLTT